MMRQFKLAICSTFQDFFFSVLFALEILNSEENMAWAF